ncbi:S8 family serine peptidase [Actinoplanes sp. TFC3]|uniref:S8 family peptidase n=1 Tax=Actinoplanes sp. TFC3 TaxID=1710355 RepID=UPI001F020B78|nr:S8 family serine peptidase [Actinoplanes sp. TFC3]
MTLPTTPARADRIRDMQWYWDDLKVSEAQQVSTGKGVTVALIDSGVDRTHPDLKGVVLPGQSMVDHQPLNNFDSKDHGTGIAGLIAGQGHGSGGDSGVRGIAPDAKILPITPVNNPTLVAQGIDWAVEQGAKVINMSFEVAASDALHEAIRKARAAGVTLVASSGNEAKEGNEPQYPGAYDEVITVGSLGKDGKIDSTSVHNRHVDIAAPGVDLPGASSEENYVSITGTSCAAGLVSAAAALIYAKYPGITANQVEARLLGTATDRGDKGRDDYYGAGALNLLDALTGPQPAADPDAVAASASSAPVAGQPYQAKPVPPGLPDWLFPIALGAVVVLVVGLIALVVVLIRRRRTA